MVARVIERIILFVRPCAHVVLSCAIALCCVIITVSLTYSTYTTTDDVYLLQVLSGAFNDAPMSWVPFWGPALAQLVSGLYRLFPDAPCYLALQRVLMTVSLAIVNTCVFLQCAKLEGKPRYAAPAIACIFLDVLFCWMFVRMHYYYSSLLTGTAAIAVVLSADFEKAQIPAVALVIVLIAFCSGYSVSASYSICLFLAIALLYRLFVTYRDNRAGFRKTLIVAGVLIALVALVVAGTLVSIKVQRADINGIAYSEWDAFRVAYWDYAVPSYDENPSLYSNVGWSRNFYLLTRKMYFMDESFSVAALSQITDKFSYGLSFADGTSLRDALRVGKSLFTSSVEARGVFVLMCGMFVASLFLISRDRRINVAVFANAVCFVLAGVLCMYLAYRGRFPLRAFVMASVPCIVFMLLTLLGNASNSTVCERIGIACANSQHDTAKESRSHLARFVGFALVVMLSYGVFVVDTFSFLSNEKSEQYYEREKAKELALYNYVSSNKSNVYVYDWTMVSTYYPFSNLEVGQIGNLFNWGGARLYTQQYYEQLRLNGRESLQSDDFLDDGVYLISNSKEDIEILRSYLSEEYGEVAYDIVDEPDEGMMVCKYFSAH